MLLGLVIAFFFIGAGLTLVKQDFSQAALNEDTKIVDVFFNGNQVHCFTIQEAEKCLEKLSKNKTSKKTLFLGNSQLHAVNQPTDSAKPVSVLLTDKLIKNNNMAVTFSQPNSSFSEQVVLLKTLLLKQNFDYFILPAVFDDTREGEIRAINKDIFLNDDYRKVLLQSAFISDLYGKKINTIQKGQLTVQDRSEKFIIQKINHFFKWENITSQLRGNISLLLYRARNSIFNIKPTTERKIIPSAYKQNILALNELLAIAKNHDLKTIVYVAPIRQDIKLPYKMSEYNKFKSDIRLISVKYGVDFLNLENIIAGPLWGLKVSSDLDGELEYDFMHFKEQGHEILAEKLFQHMDHKYLKNDF